MQGKQARGASRERAALEDRDDGAVRRGLATVIHPTLWQVRDSQHLANEFADTLCHDSVYGV